MPIESESDRAVFFSTDEFAVAAEYTPVGAAATPLVGIFNDPHMPVLTIARVPASDSRPTFLCPSADLPAGAKGGDAGDTLAFAAGVLPDHPDPMTYRVIDIEPDGTGMALLILGS